MHENINKLSEMLALNKYQAYKLRARCDMYNMGRLEKRGGVLYAPYATHGVWQCLCRLIFGRRADLIGQDKMLLQAQRNIKFCANGYHSVRVGKHTYYANAAGQVISRSEFLKNRKI